jgi:site-specific DNA recombinase
MNLIRAAIYARVSSEQQAAAHTIESQRAALTERAHADGLPVPQERQFLDDGYNGATLVRPAMDRLRDLAAVGGLDRIYVNSPDRLARNYACQVLLIDEWRRAGVEIIFLNRSLGKSPEDDLLLQVQGIVSEYERAKIMERSRRGKKHTAQRGSLNVMSNAPFGYRYITVHDGGAKPGLKPFQSRRPSSGTSSNGLDRNGAPLERSAVVFKAPAKSRPPGSAFGLGRPFGTFFRIPFLREQPPMAKHG